MKFSPLKGRFHPLTTQRPIVNIYIRPWACVQWGYWDAGSMADFVLLKLYNSPFLTIGQHLPFDWYIWDSSWQRHFKLKSAFLRAESRNIWAVFMRLFHGHLSLHSPIVQFRLRCSSSKVIFYFAFWGIFLKTTTQLQRCKYGQHFQPSPICVVLSLKYFMAVWRFWQLSTQKW